MTRKPWFFTVSSVAVYASIAIASGVVVLIVVVVMLLVVGRLDALVGLTGRLKSFAYYLLTRYVWLPS